MKLLTSSQLQKELNLSKSALKRLVARGLPVLRIPGMAPRYNLDSVTDWLSRFEVQATPPSVPTVQATPPVIWDHAKKLPKGIHYINDTPQLRIDYRLPNRKRILKTANTTDIQTAIELRKQAISEAWQDEPDSTRKRRYLAANL